MLTLYIYSILLTFIAAFLRCYRLGKWSFWEDELFTIRHATDISKGGLQAIDNCHPLYYLAIIPVMRRFGVNEWSARFPSACIGTLSVPILIFALHPIIGTFSAILFGTLLAISPWHVYWSQNARFYTITFLLQFLALLNFYQWTETSHWQFLWLFLGLYALSVLAHETSAISLIVAMVYLAGVTILATSAPAITTITIAIGAVLLAAMYSTAVFLFVGGGYWKRKKMIRSHWKTHYSHRRSGPFRILGGSFKYIGIATVCAALTLLASHFSHFSHFDIFILVLMSVPLALVTAGSLLAYSTTRYSFLSLAGYLLAAAQLTNELSSSVAWAGVGVSCILCATAIDELSLYYFAQNGNRERWREVLMTLKPRIKASDRVLTTVPDLVNHYLERHVRWVTEFNLQMLDSLNGVNWFILNDAVQSLPEEVSRWIDQHTTLVLNDEVHFHMKNWNVSVRRYEAKPTSVQDSSTHSPE